MGFRQRVAAVTRIKPLSILLADDTLELQALFTGWLEEAGHTVRVASNGSQVVQWVQEQPFDLVVTDILMPGGDGWDAIAAVQRLHPGVRILAISGGARQMPASAVLRVAHRAGALGFLAKPFSRPEFLDAVTSVMSRKRAVRAIKS
jgi:CheY-like chemotaxis protein